VCVFFCLAITLFQRRLIEYARPFFLLGVELDDRPCVAGLRLRGGAGQQPQVHPVLLLLQLHVRVLHFYQPHQRDRFAGWLYRGRQSNVVRGGVPSCPK